MWFYVCDIVQLLHVRIHDLQNLSGYLSDWSKISYVHTTGISEFKILPSLMNGWIFNGPFLVLISYQTTMFGLCSFRLPRLLLGRQKSRVFFDFSTPSLCTLTFQGSDCKSLVSPALKVPLNLNISTRNLDLNFY